VKFKSGPKNIVTKKTYSERVKKDTAGKIRGPSVTRKPRKGEEGDKI
jgi:hypothetical protein